MKIENGVLLEVNENDLVNGTFYNEEIVEIGDYCFYDIPTLREVNCPNVVRIGNYCFRYNQNLKSINLPKLKESGNICFVVNQNLKSINFPKLKECGVWCFCDNDNLESLQLNQHNLSVIDADGDLFVIENQRERGDITIYSGCGINRIEDGEIEKYRKCYVVEKDGFKAHGETIKQAINDVEFKIKSEKVKNQPITLDTEMTVDYYRMITGACRFGIKGWMKGNGIPFKVENEGEEDERIVEESPIKVKDLLPMLERTDAWGVGKIKRLLNKSY